MDNRQKEKKDMKSSGKEHKQHQGAPDMNHKKYGKHTKDESAGASKNTTKKQSNSV